MRAIIGAVALTVLAATPAFAEPTPAPTQPAPAQTTVVRQPTTVKGFKATVRTTTDGTVHRNKIRVFGGTPRQVEIQYSSDGTTWVTQKIKQTDPDGRVKIRMTVAPDRNRWRVKVPATADHKRVRTPVKTFAVQAKETESATPPFPSITASQVEANKAYARVYILNTYGWGDDQWLALEQLWTRESGWNHLAVNPTSGATGIPQALPGDKMATAGSDWKTNPQTQIRWGASYIKGRYKDPLGAWAHFKAKNWY